MTSPKVRAAVDLWWDVCRAHQLRLDAEERGANARDIGGAGSEDLDAEELMERDMDAR